MAVKQVQKDPSNVTVKDTDQLSLTVTIGNAQIGGNLVLLDGIQAGKGDITGLPLGNGSSLKGKTLKVITNVLDVNPNTNKVSITHIFTNGTPPDYVNNDSVDNDGDIYSLTAQYNFI